MKKSSIKFTKLLLIIIGFFIVSSHSVQAATYDWYFSYSTGDNTTGDGSIGNPWKTLAKVQTQEDTLSASDVANFYFKRGDTWSFTHDGSPSAEVSFNNCLVNIDAYGTGAAPIFDGGITFATNPLTDVPARNTWDSVISIGYTGSSVKNIEIKNHHAHGLFINCPAKNVTVQDVLVHNVGFAGITTSTECENYGNVIEYCTVYDAQRKEELWPTGSYGGGIGCTGFGASNVPHDNTIRYCHVYNVYGEGLWNPNGITEYNVVGPTFSACIHAPVQDWPARTTIIRYNLVYGNTSSAYHSAAMSDGIVFADDESGSTQNNGSGESWVYGNLIVSRSRGIRIYDPSGNSVTYPYGKIRLFNNTIIDSAVASISATSPNSFADVKIYNNSSILYTASTYGHVIDDFTTDAQWVIDYNHFWSTVGTAVDSTWQTHYVTSDPKLPKTTGWRAISTDKDTIDFATFFVPDSGSALLGNGMTLDSEFDGMTDLFTQGTDFTGDLSSASFVVQNQTIPFSLGAVLRTDGDVTPPSVPQGLSVE